VSGHLGGKLALFRSLFAGLLALGGLALTLTIWLAVILFWYGIALLFLRYAFGIELPNPIDWLPQDIAKKLR